MDFNVVLDVSSIIWNEIDYKNNTFQYFDLAEEISKLFFKLKVEKPKILLCKELIDEMFASFPYRKIPYHLSDFESQTLNFLRNIQPVMYRDFIVPVFEIISTPNLVKEYYSDTTQKEIISLISEIHLDEDTQNIYFTFKYLWDNKVIKLKTEANEETREYETIISDKGTSLDDFFTKYKLIFKHKSKHNCSKYQNKDAWNDSEDKGSFPSQLSCYCDNDESIVQTILDKRYTKCFGNDSYYGYDAINSFYVIFRITGNNIYHAYDMYDIERIPQEVKKHFSVWRY